LEAADEMIKWVEEEGAEKVDSEIMVRFLGRIPGWNEKNFQVYSNLLNRMPG
jgi:cytoskeleton-associated protein 5